MKKLLLFLIFIFFIFSCGENDMNSADGNDKSDSVKKTLIKKTQNKAELNKENETYTKPLNDDYDYYSKWKEVEKNDDFPKTALKTVEEIYKHAKSKNNYSQYIKSLIFKMKYIQKVEENTLVKVNKMLLNELKEAKAPVKQILHSMIAEQYWNYYRQNRYRFLKRTKVDKADEYDLKTWSLDKIIKELERHYNLSLSDDNITKKIRIDDYSEILVNRKDTRELHPYLYDFLIYRAISFYSDNESSLTKPAYYFKINDKKYFETPEKFVKLKIESKDKESFDYIALKLYQKWEAFHLNDKDKDSLTDIWLSRLEYVYNKGKIADKVALYENTLKEITEKYKSDVVAEAFEKLASLYLELSQKYNPDSGKKYKGYKKRAHEICLNTVKTYKNSFGAMNCKKLLKRIEKKNIMLTLNNVNPINKYFKASIQYTNVNKIYVKIIKTDFEEYRKQRNRYYDLLKYYLSKKEDTIDKEFNLPDDGDFNTYRTEIPFPKLKNGKYVVLASDTKDFDIDKSIITYNVLDVTNIALLKKKGKGETHFYLRDLESGKPLKDARVIIYTEEWNGNGYKVKKRKKVKADLKGHIRLVNNMFNRNSFYLKIYTGNDEYFPLTPFYTDYYYNGRRLHKETFFFTDRKIYRPGQTLYFKALVVEKDNYDGKNTKILPNVKRTVTLYDPNGQKVSSLNLKTNEFGTINGNFILPQDRLNGRYSISDGIGLYYFSVEEYKVPKFEVKFDKQDKEYKLNDIVKVKGVAKAYAGFNIDGATVRYRVVRETYYPFSWYWYYYIPPTQKIEIKNGFTKTNENGEFEINFKALADSVADKNKKPAFRYTVYADVTDLNGETHSAEKRFSIGYVSLLLNLSLEKSYLDKSLKNVDLSIDSTNLNGDFIPASGKLEVYKLKTPEKPVIKRNWRKPDKFFMTKKEFNEKFPFDEYDEETNFYKWEKETLVFTTPFDTSESKKITVKNINKWKTGKYLFIVKSKDKQGNEVLNKLYVDLLDNKSKNMPYASPFFFKALKTDAKVGEKAEFLIGSSFKDVHVIYEVENKGKLKTKEIILNNELKKISIPVTSKHRGNFTVRFITVKYGTMFDFEKLIHVPWDNKKLKITFETFRDKLYPGQKEEWKLKIEGYKKEKVLAEMLATMYDASLDAFKANSWYLSLFPYLYREYYWSGNFNYNNSSYLKYNYEGYGIVKKHYDELNWFGFYWMNNMFFRAGRSRIMRKSAVRTDSVVYEAEAPQPSPTGKSIPKKKTKTLETPVSEDKQNLKKENKELKPQIRKNFAQTVFFYPNLKTDKNGNIIISFKLPDSLTKWKMLGFAHTKDLKYGFIQKTLVTQKDLMVIPNAPRFLREGDKIKFTAKVKNLTQNDLSTEVTLKLFDAITMKPVDKKFNNIVAINKVNIKKEGSVLLSWDLEIPFDVDAVIYRIVAKSDKFSDGEEKVIPVLKNRMLVTQTLPLPVRAKESKVFKFKDLISNDSKTLKNHKLTLEFTANPVWYAVEALPYLMEYPYECNEQTFSRYYANSLAAYIINSKPIIKRVFESWKTKNSKELISNLEKNEELKSIILKETPWIRDAYDETERKKRIALLFNFNKMSKELNSALNKLKDNQMPSGGWSWFKGGYESRWVTQYIVSGFAHLNKLGVIDIKSDKNVKNMIKKAVAYLDRNIESDYNYLVEKKMDLSLNHLGYLQIQYLYSRAYFKDMFEIPQNTTKAFNYYMEQSKKYWNKFSKYFQGMIALYLNKNGNFELAKTILKSIKEHFIEDEEMGIYLKESYGYYWYNAPIETHALLIEAFSEITEDEKVVDGLKTWLLKSKQTQNWKTTKATVNAIYALLLKGNNWLKEAKLPDITIGKYKIVYNEKDTVKGNENIKYVEVEKGTGYFKTSWSGKEINKDMGVIKIKNNNDLVAWGGLYWQYFEDLDKIKFAQTPLSLTKKLFVERNTEKGPVLKPIEKESIKVGDRIKVRIILKVDRDMEYVHMKDMRASALEPENIISRYKWQDGLGYYESAKDASTDFFFDILGKGTYVFEYPLRVTHEGDFSNGITTIQCMYAPEFTSHSEGIRIKVK